MKVHITVLALSLATLAGVGMPRASGAAAPDLFHSPNDDGASVGIPAIVPSGQSVTLHLYLGVGATASSADPCFMGDGDELCGYRLRLTGSGVNLQSFTPSDPDTLFNQGGSQIELIGSSFQVGQLGPTKLGDLVIDGPAQGGTLDLVVGTSCPRRS